jgi:phage shock protein A
MRLFKRISSTVLASVDKVISEVENHDAVVESMLRDLKQASAESKVRLNRVKHDGDKMKKELITLTETDQVWTERASKLAKLETPVSQEKALACLERRRLCREQILLIEERLVQHAVIQKQLEDQLRTIGNRQSEISNKRHLLQSQQAVSEANRVVAAVNGSGSIDVDAAFDRWEISIAKSDVGTMNVSSNNDIPFDDFDLELADSEVNESLLSELAELKSMASGSSSSTAKKDQ